MGPGEGGWVEGSLLVPSGPSSVFPKSPPLTAKSESDTEISIITDVETVAKLFWNSASHCRHSCQCVGGMVAEDEPLGVSPGMDGLTVKVGVDQQK